MFKGKTSVLEGSMAIAQAVRASRPGVISAYPITPQTHIVEFLANMVANGELKAEYVRVDSEFSAASVIAGASAAGVRAYTASSSQGLLLMTEVIYYLAGARLPVVLTAANRQVSAPVGLQPDHQDSVTFRDAGMIQLYVESAQEAYDTHIQAFRIAEDHGVLSPTMVCCDGYILTHVYEPVKTFEQAEIDSFLPAYDPVHYLTPEQPMVFGAISDENNHYEFRYMHEQAMHHAAEVIDAVANEWRARTGHYSGGLIDAYCLDDAEIAFVAMGSTCSTLREAVDEMRAGGIKVGLLKIRSLRPFPAAQIRAALDGVGAAVVLDRAFSAGYGGVLGIDVKAALYDAAHRPLVLELLAGYGGREVTLDTSREMVDRARRALDAGKANPELEWVGLRPANLPVN